jgi:predicted Zn-dependent peptidase
LIRYIKYWCIYWLTSLFVSIYSLKAQPNQLSLSWQEKTEAGYTYKYVPADPIQLRVYTLKNGLTIYLTPNRTEPRIFAAVTVRAGSKNDPATHTGLAHYLEHMLFKGTDRFGTLDYNREKIELDKIYQLYETYNQTTDPEKRKAIYRQIDSVSAVAARYAIPNEYDKMTALMGANNTNAFTTEEQTCYYTDIPANQLHRWIKLEAERFRLFCPRLFHTELEAVYEEKNIAIDKDSEQVNDSLMQGLFPNHTYGTQTTIGTVEHLKNPSLHKIEVFFNTYYVANNMAIILSGDLDPNTTIAALDSGFGSWPSRPVPEFRVPMLPPIQRPVVKTVIGPDPESVVFGYRFPGAGHKDIRILRVVDMLLSNSTAGLIDLNLVQQQKLLLAGSLVREMRDYSYHQFFGVPSKGQSLEKVRILIQEQIRKLAEGEFTDQDIQAVVRNWKINQLESWQRNENRVFEIATMFTQKLDWATMVQESNLMLQITRADIINFVKKYYTDNNYVVVYKKVGQRPKSEKITKPPITPVATNADTQSLFIQQFKEIATNPIEPRFMDFNTDIGHHKITARTFKGAVPVQIPLYRVSNTENDLFKLTIEIQIGSRHHKWMGLMPIYLPFVSIADMTAGQIARQFYRLGCTYTLNVTSQKTQFHLSGLNESLPEAVNLLLRLLKTGKADQAACRKMVQSILKDRSDQKLSREAILQRLKAYARYGAYNTYTDILSAAELEKLHAAELNLFLSQLLSYPFEIMYYGPASAAVLDSLFFSWLPDSAFLLPPQRPNYQIQDFNENEVFFVDHEMVQAELFWQSKPIAFKEALIPIIELYNEYFNGGMGSIVFQTLRESRALAYSANSFLALPTRSQEPIFNTGYMGTQADKFREAVDGMLELWQKLPYSPSGWQIACQSLQNRIATERILRDDIFLVYQWCKEIGITGDWRKNIYTAAQSLTFDELQTFHAQQLQKLPFRLCVLGSKKRLSLQEMSRYGKVRELKLTEIFGY